MSRATIHTRWTINPTMKAFVIDRKEGDVKIWAETAVTQRRNSREPKDCREPPEMMREAWDRPCIWASKGSQPVTPGFWSPGLQNYETIHLRNDLSLTVCEYRAGVTVEELNFNAGTAMGAGRCSQAWLLWWMNTEAGDFIRSLPTITVWCHSAWEERPAQPLFVPKTSGAKSN